MDMLCSDFFGGDTQAVTTCRAALASLLVHEWHQCHPTSSAVDISAWPGCEGQALNVADCSRVGRCREPCPNPIRNMQADRVKR
jgi:hypothetical protein